MVSLRWGDVLSTLLPGAVAVYALVPWVPLFQQWLNRIDTFGPGVALLMASALTGGVLEAVTRISWERWLNGVHPLPRMLDRLTPENAELFEQGVQNSYKYFTFYANFALALVAVFVSEIVRNPRQIWPVLIVAVIVILGRASYVQWTYYASYQSQVFGSRGDNAKKLPATRK